MHEAPFRAISVVAHLRSARLVLPHCTADAARIQEQDAPAGALPESANRTA